MKQENGYAPYRGLHKEANENLVLHAIKRNGPLSVPDLMRKLALSRPTVDDAVRRLHSRSLVRAAGTGTGTVGRRPTLWTIDAQAGFMIGVDLEYPSASVVVTNLQLKILKYERSYVDAATTPNEILDMLFVMIDRVLTAAGADGGKLFGIGLGVPGLIDRRRGLSVQIERAPFWTEVPVVSAFEERYRCPVFLENDVTMMLLAEKYFNRNLDGVTDFVYVGLRTGLGAGLFLNGKPSTGEDGNAGFIGHITVDPQGPVCRCGNTGCLELYSGEPAILESIDRNVPMTERHRTRLHMGDLPELADSFPEQTGAVFHDVASYLAIGIVSFVNLLDLSTVILGGNIVYAGNLFLEYLQREVAARVMHTQRDKVDVRFGSVTENTAALGAAVLVMKDVFEEEVFHPLPNLL